ncbi:hypothetical protein ACFQ2T_05050 [Methylophilus flavus]|uniref:Uncharacterized protein n=1 Tax=Methylophilus flavus TaxID=640084 RepID=A0ABW3PD78_9PROT
MRPTTVTVYKVAIYDGVHDDVIISKRYATEDGAKRMNGRLIANTAVVVSVKDLEQGEQWTAKGYLPP